ncbi:MAG: ATP synthase F1 subunit epsilon [Bacteroidales bacterium]
MKLEILTPESELFSGEVSLVSLPGTLGAFEILQNHAPIISTLAAGTVKVIDAGGRKQEYQIRGGVVECVDNQVHVLVTLA